MTDEQCTVEGCDWNVEPDEMFDAALCWLHLNEAHQEAAADDAIKRAKEQA